MGEVRIHDDYEVASRELQSVDVGCSKTKLAGAGLQFDMRGTVGFDELFGDFLGSIGGAVVDDYDFPVELAAVASCQRFL